MKNNNKEKFKTNMSLLTNYKESLEAIYNHVGFVEDYVIYPIDDATDCFWFVEDNKVHYADSVKELDNRDGNYYVDDVYTQRFYTKHIYKGKDFTMIFCDPHVDGMKYFRIFDNSKFIKQQGKL